ncbi:glycosyltransferase [Clostridium bowmanii]|nr:glycosyltransferase [Clostridium bowmanii]MBU3190776.1 glycosyltransferase [Clostridium bowmanii]MCA1074978.1 glycosyltransferase [Clostridium bowmanii]
MLIVGDGPDRKSLEQYAKELDIADRVIFTGVISPYDIGAYYQIGDVFVSASNSETQGLTYIEALANGVPTICRKDPCLENVVKNGVNGWQYETFEQFNDELYFTISRDNDDLRKNAIESAYKDFSSDMFAKKIEHIYQDTISAYKKNYRIKTLSVLDYTEVVKR